MGTSLGNSVSISPWLILAALLAPTGCNGLRSRYAMDDPVYAEKYQEGAEKGDVPGKLKQAVDARHVEGLSGMYLSGGTFYRPESDRTFGGAELGIENYPAPWNSWRMSLGGYTSEDQGYVGVDGGIRLQTPTRLAPFVGLGTTNGFSRSVEDGTHDGRDNDDDQFIDEPGETITGIDRTFFSIYPEVGAHFWLNGRWRLTTFGRYMMTSFGRDDDDWMIGGSVAAFAR
ncbi:MAG: hypothetical protein U0905_13150 [Pirellulales bacterium]